MEVSVAGSAIPQEQIFREAQYHPAGSWAAACHEATRALVIRRLLLLEAEERGVARLTEDSDERQVQDALDGVLQQAIEVPEVTEDECLAFYAANRGRFVGEELYEASHILLGCSRDPEERHVTRTRARQLLEVLRADPGRFERTAREVSACPSAGSGGRLGQLSPGESLPEFERVLQELRPGELCSSPVETQHGFHLVRLDDRSAGRALPYASVEAKIRIYLRERGFRGRLQAYIQDLAERRGVLGFDLNATAPAAKPSDIPAQYASAPEARVASMPTQGRRHLPLVTA